ncbi:MAG: tyrosine-type recombinase/integrase [Myxococcota bacterium]
MRVLKESLPNGRFRVRVERHDGGFVTLDTYDTASEANAAREQMRAILRDKGVDRSAMTVTRWCRRFAKGRTEQDRRRVEQHIAEDELGSMPLKSLGRRDVKRWLRRLERRRAMVRGPGRTMVPSGRVLSAKTRIELFGLLRMALDEAVDEELIKANPAGTVKRPEAAGRKAFGYLYPAEDARLLGSSDVPLAYRFAYGFLGREGMRVSEAVRLLWTDIDLVRGIISLDENKTNDPRSWALDPAVVRALVRWRQEQPGRPAHVIVGSQGRPLKTLRCERYRRHLRKAGVTRPELYAATKNRQPIRIHDRRAGFITLSLASGRNERWVQDRTGHTTNAMLQTYHRMARTAAEVGLGFYAPLDVALGWAEADPKPDHSGPSGGELAGQLKALAKNAKRVQVSYPAPVGDQDASVFEALGTGESPRSAFAGAKRGR